MKKLLAIVLTFVLLISVVPFGALTVSAATSGTIGNCNWSLNGTVLTISGNGEMRDEAFHTKFGPDGVTYSTSAPWNSYLKTITQVIIENGVTRIGNGSFAYCTALTNVIIPASVISITDTSFKGCTSLKSIDVDVNNNNYCSLNGVLFNKDKSVLMLYPAAKNSVSYAIPNSVTSISKCAFAECSNLESVIVGEGVKVINNEVFCNCTKLADIVIPDSVTNIGINVFYNTAYYNDIEKWENDVLYIGNHLIKVKDTIEGDYQVKAKTKTIAKSAFYNCSKLTNITIPDSILNIGDSAFYYCSGLISATLGNGIISINDSTFSGCSSLVSVNIPNNVETIGPEAFYNCENLTNIIIPNDVSVIGHQAFRYCDKLTNIIIPNNVTTIGASAFGNCSELTSITMGKGVTQIYDGAFSGCGKISNVHITDLTNWCRIEFKNCRANPMYYGADIYLNGEKLLNLNIPQGIESIEDYAFNGATIEQVNIPESVTKIAYKCFENCGNLSNIELAGELEELDGYAFHGSPWYENQSDGIVNIKSSLYHYKGEMAQDSEINIVDGTDIIANYAFYDCDNLVSVTIPDSVKSIGYKAFCDCDNLKNIIIGSGTSKVDITAFTECKSLSNITVNENNAIYSSFEGVLYNKDKSELLLYPANKTNTLYTIPNNVKSIGNNAFYNCIKLTNIIIPNSVTSIGDKAFNNCTGLTNINISNSVTNMGDEVFYNCDSLTNVTIGNNVTSIGSYAFGWCEKLANVTIGSSVTSIGYSAFYYCENLKSITIPYSVKSIENGAFSLCNNIKDVWYDGTKIDRGKIKIGTSNSNLENATWHYSSNECNHKYLNNITKATLTANGSLATKCSVCNTVAKTTTIAKIASVTTTAKVTYNGKKKTPTVTVKDANGKVISSGNYTVKYASGRKNYGKYKITVTFKGNYSGKKTIYFEIVPKNTKVSKLTAAKKSLKVKLSRQKKATGYQIQYSLKKNFKSAKTVTLKKNSITSKTIKKLKPKKTYYVRVRTYKTYKGKKYYSAWSSAKKKKTK